MSLYIYQFYKRRICINFIHVDYLHLTYLIITLYQTHVHVLIMNKEKYRHAYSPLQIIEKALVHINFNGRLFILHGIQVDPNM